MRCDSSHVTEAVVVGAITLCLVGEISELTSEAVFVLKSVPLIAVRPCSGLGGVRWGEGEDVTGGVRV